MRGGFRKGVGIGPKKLDQMMKQVGINVEELEGVEEVVIKMADAELVFEDASVTIMKTPGSKMYQITGTPVERPKTKSAAETEVVGEGVAGPEPELRILPEDVEIVKEKVGCSEEEARAALTEAKGDLVEAISQLCGLDL